MNTKLLVNGKLVKGKGEELGVLDPATGKVIAQVAEASEEQITAAVKAAAKAFAGWAATVPKDRGALLMKLADRIEAEALEFARLESQNCGKPLNAALNDEIPAIADVFRFFAGAARTMHGALAGEYLPGFTSMIRRDPIGVVASIAPWNYPLMMAAWKMAPALAAGNTVVLKPSEQTPLTTLKLATICAELFPPGVVNIVCGRGNTVGAPLVAQPEVDDLAHGFRRERREGAHGRREWHQTHAPRVGRQGAGHRVRRRGPGISGEWRAHFRFLQCRAGLHRRVPHLRRPQDLRQAGR